MPTPHRQPRYRAIADELRRRITAGVIPAGALIPSESALNAEFRVARGTIREAINVLRNEGMVVTEHGRGTYTRPNLPIRRLGADRYRVKTHQTARVNLAGRGTKYDEVEQVDIDYREVSATSEVADIFGVSTGTMLLQRRLLVKICGLPQQLTISYYLLDMVSGTPVADPAREPWPGGHVAQLGSLGIAVTKIQEIVGARMPTSEEVGLFRLSAGVPLITVTRRTMSGTRIVEAATGAVLPADRIELEYEFMDPW